MKIVVKKRCESGDMISLPVKDKAAAGKLVVAMQNDVVDPASHMQGATLVAVLGGKAIINQVARFTPGTYTVPAEVGENLIKHKLAIKA